MDRLLVYLGRYTVILLGYLFASLAAGAFLTFLWVGPLAKDAAIDPWLVVSSMIFTVPLLTVFTAYYAFFPAVLAIALAEMLGARDWLYHALAGAAVGVAVTGFGWADGYLKSGGATTDERLADANLMFSDLSVALGIIGGGLVAGIAYWLVAGRGSGAWRVQASARR